MANEQPKLRNAAKAIIIEDGQILVTKNEDQDGVYYLLPGGGQDGGETLLDTIIRECNEEIGAGIEPGVLCFVREYIGRNHEFAAENGHVHQVDFIFACRLLTRPSLTNATGIDSWQTGIEWIQLEALGQANFYPQALKAKLEELGSTSTHIDAQPIYLGDIN